MKQSFQKIVVGFVCASLILSGAACSNTTGTEGDPKRVTIEWWTVFKDTDNLDSLIAAYQAQNPHVTINVRNIRYIDFKDDLLNALAEDRGPDIFTIHNTEVGEYQTKITPMPATTIMETAVQKGAIQKKTYTEKITVPSYTPRYITQTFLDQVQKDLYINSQLWGLPLSVDTLALFYNKPLLAAAGISLPAQDYTKLQEHVIKLTKQTPTGGIAQSGIAMGTSGNVERFSDILSLLMMQNGTIMASDSGAPRFHTLPEELGRRETLPAADALAFYSDFASPTKQVYTWNDTKPNSLEAFMSGTVGYFLGYAYHIPTIKTQAPKLNFGITKAPQIAGNIEINFANYWVEVVSNKSKNQDVAWNFLQFIAKPENVKSYLDAAKLPTATKNLVDAQKEDLEIGVFAEQLLTAQSWYKGKNPLAVDEAFAEMLTRYKAGLEKPQQILERAAARINATR